MIGIYIIYNTISKKWYVGSAINISDRWSAHKSKLKKNKHANIHLQRAWNKDREHSFQFHVLEYCSKENMLEREQYWIDRSKCTDPSIGYNILITADSPLGLKRSEETKRKISLVQKGKKLSDETKMKMRLATRVISKESRIKLGLSNLGKPRLESVKLKISETLKGHKGVCHTNETKIKISQAAVRKYVKKAYAIEAM